MTTNPTAPQDGGEKPCPFCGSKDVQSIVNRAEKVHPYRIVCSGCGMATAHHGSYQQCFAAWNTRATPDLAAVRNAALEEAAKVADEYAFQSRSRAANNNPYDAILLAGYIANHVRSLQQEGPSNG